MAKCLQCKKQYHAGDFDAGAYRELFCSVTCEQNYEQELETHISPGKNIFTEFEETIIDNPPSVQEAAEWALTEMNALAQNGQLSDRLSNVRTRLSVALSLAGNRQKRGR